MNKPDPFISRPDTRYLHAFGLGDRTQYPAFLLVVSDGRWLIRPVVSKATPYGGWFDSGRMYALADGTNADGDDLFLLEEHAAAEVIRRNMRTGGWDGKR